MSIEKELEFEKAKVVMLRGCLQSCVDAIEKLSPEADLKEFTMVALLVRIALDETNPDLSSDELMKNITENLNKFKEKAKC